MQFAHPSWLWFLLALPVLALWWLWGRRQAAFRYPEAQSLARLPAGGARLAEATSLILRLGVVGLLILGLSRPRWPDEQTRIPADSRALQVVLDVSGSMAEKDFLAAGEPLSRLDAARQALQWFILDAESARAARTGDMIGLLTFAARAEEVCPPTLSHSVVLRLLDEAKPLGVPPDSSTNLGDAIVEGLELLQRASPRRKIMLVVSDGEHNVPATVVRDALKPRPAARLAQALDVRIYTIYVGPNAPREESPTAGTSPQPGVAALRDVAALTSGRSFQAQDHAALFQVCQEIEQLEQSRIESFKYYRYHEAYPWVGLACVVLLIGRLTVEGTRWLKVP
jgi:Ca-activated chloride channel family protein